MISLSDSSPASILDQKPYVTKRELSLLWEKKGKSLDNRVQTQLRNGKLVSLKNGLYVSRGYLQRQTGGVIYAEYVANILYYPSYLSLEYVLQKEGIIPESVYEFTSVTNKITRTYRNELGSFSYRRVKSELFTGFREGSSNGSGNWRIKTATKAKALFDWLYLKTFVNSLTQEIQHDLRINWEVFEATDVEEFGRYTRLSRMKKMAQIYSIIQALGFINK